MSKSCYLQEHPLFAHLGTGKIESMSNLLKVKAYSRGDICGYGEGAYHKICLLLNGKIKIAAKDDAGDELAKDILTSPDIFGDLSLEGVSAPDEYAVALTAGTLVGSFAITDFRKILEDHPMMALGYAHIVNRKLKRLEDRHSDLVFRDAKYRLIRFIKSWARNEGNRIGNKIILSNYLTHSDIAGVIATSRQSVNVLFNELRDAGLLYYNRKRIELNDTGGWN
jgi:CRP/FNR family transcriptional regulator, cyclic AMP receptor protein